MSRPNYQSPRAYNSNNGEGARNFRQPFFSPEKNAAPEFSGYSPMKRNFGWRNPPNQSNRRYFQNEYSSQNYNYSPAKGRRGGVGPYRRGGHHPGGRRSTDADISLYANPSMLGDPWKDLVDSYTGTSGINELPIRGSDTNNKNSKEENSIKPDEEESDTSNRTISESQNEIDDDLPNNGVVE